MKIPYQTVKLPRALSLSTVVACCAALIIVPMADAKSGKDKGGDKNKTHKKIEKEHKKEHKKDKDHSDKKHEKQHRKEHKAAKKHFEHFHDNNVITLREYFTPYRSAHGLPPGIAKKIAKGKALPPGWHKKLHHGQRLDDGLWNSLIPLPNDLRQRIRYENDPYRYYILNDRIVRVHPDNRTLLGVILLSELLN